LLGSRLKNNALNVLNTTLPVTPAKAHHERKTTDLYGPRLHDK